MTIHIQPDRMDAVEAGQWAIRVDADTDTDTWTVSWLDGTWTRNQAITALNIADIVAHHPPMHHQAWRAIEALLTELGLDPAVLDELIDPEDTEVEEQS
ncbi:MAG: hypothetical protein ACRD0P_14615 [Stackebrandtia sp.]